MQKRTLRIAVGAAALVSLTGLAAGSWMWLHPEPFVGKFAGGDPDQLSSATTPGEDPVGGFEAYRSAARTYPADGSRRRPSRTPRPRSSRSRSRTPRRAIRAPRGTSGISSAREGGRQPGVTSFSGATNNTASRITALVVSPGCTAAQCRVWVGASGGGVWRTDNALAGEPGVEAAQPEQLDQNSVGALTLDPTDKTGQHALPRHRRGATAARPAARPGVGIYKSTNGGEHWTKLADACVSNATYPCVNPGKDAFLGRGINVDRDRPAQREPHLRRLGAGRPRPLARDRQRRHRRASSRARTSPASTSRPTAARPSPRSGTAPSPTRASASASPTSGSTRSTSTSSTRRRSTQGVWRRDAGRGPTAFSQVFAPQFAGRRHRPDDVRADREERAHADRT